MFNKIENFSHATQYPRKYSAVSTTRIEKDRSNKITLISFGSLLTNIAAAKNEGNKTIT